VKGLESALWSLEHARSGHHGFRSAIARVAAELRRGSIEDLVEFARYPPRLRPAVVGRISGRGRRPLLQQLLQGGTPRLKFLARNQSRNTTQSQRGYDIRRIEIRK
jgi:hypothetical protein